MWNRFIYIHDRSTQWSGGFRGFSTLSQIVRPKEILERSIINVFPCVALFSSNLVLSYVKVLNLLFSNRYNFASKNLFVG